MDTAPKPKNIEAPNTSEAPVTPEDKNKARYERTLAKLELDIAEAQKEKEILSSMRVEIPLKAAATTEQKDNFLTQLSTLRRFSDGRGDPDVFLNAMLRHNESGEHAFSEDITALNGSIEGFNQEITQLNQERQEELDVKYKVA